MMWLLLFHHVLCRDINDKHRRLAEITEMIHTASLVHDDVLDECDIRRGEFAETCSHVGICVVRERDFFGGNQLDYSTRELNFYNFYDLICGHVVGRSRPGACKKGFLCLNVLVRVVALAQQP